MKKFALLVLVLSVLLTVAACGASDSGNVEIENDIQSEESMEDTPQEMAQEIVPAEMTEIDQQVLAYFQEMYDQIPQLKESCEGGSEDGQWLASGYYEDFVSFSFGGLFLDRDGIVYGEPGQVIYPEPHFLAFHDMAKAGQKKYVEMMREFDETLYEFLADVVKEVRSEEHSWISHAEEMFGLTDRKFDQKKVEEIEEQWIEGWEPTPVYRMYYREFYNTFFASDE